MIRRFAPSPLRGEGWGEGGQCAALLARPVDKALTRHPLTSSPSPMRGEGRVGGVQP
jgi:hypothetical protein